MLSNNSLLIQQIYPGAGRGRKKVSAKQLDSSQNAPKFQAIMEREVAIQIMSWYHNDGLNIKVQRALASGIAVKFTSSTLVACDSQVWIPGTDLAPLIKPRCGGIHMQNRESLAQMLAQWRPSSSKKRKIDNICSLRANLCHKKRKIYNSWLAQWHSS